MIQSNQSIEDMLYSGHLVMADTVSWNRPNRGQTLIEKTLHSDTFIARQFFGYWVKSSSQIFLFIADTQYFLW